MTTRTRCLRLRSQRQYRYVSLSSSCRICFPQPQHKNLRSVDASGNTYTHNVHSVTQPRNWSPPPLPFADGRHQVRLLTKYDQLAGGCPLFSCNCVHCTVWHQNVIVLFKSVLRSRRSRNYFEDPRSRNYLFNKYWMNKNSFLPPLRHISYVTDVIVHFTGLELEPELK